MSVYTQNYNIDGWPVCKDGEPMGRKDCLAELQKLEAQLAALKEENERLSDGLSHHMNISQVLADGNANMYEMVMERDAEIELLKARVAELEAKDPNLINTCGCRFENDTGNSVLLCEACSELPCHNPNAETKDPANARLIAAAPELLSLLKEARSTLEMWKDVAPAVSLCADIDKAIAQATGG